MIRKGTVLPVTLAVAASTLLHAAALAGLPALLGAAAGSGEAPAAEALTVRLASRAKPPPARKVQIAQAPRRAGAEGPRYWRGSELDVRPAPLASVDPVPSAAAGNKAGRVVARVLISESGNADRVLIEKSDPAGLFDEAVVSAFKKARYRPGSKNGIRVKSQMLVEVTFHRAAPLSVPPARAAK